MLSADRRGEKQSEAGVFLASDDCGKRNLPFLKRHLGFEFIIDSNFQRTVVRYSDEDSRHADIGRFDKKLPTILQNMESESSVIDDRDSEGFSSILRSRLRIVIDRGEQIDEVHEIFD